MPTKDAQLAPRVQLIAASFNVIHAILRRGQQRDIAAIGLTGPQVSLLQTLAISDGLTLKQLSERLGLAHSTVSGIVDRLERKAMVSRRPDAAAVGDLSLINGDVIQYFLENCGLRIAD